MPSSTAAASYGARASPGVGGHSAPRARNSALRTSGARAAPAGGWNSHASSSALATPARRRASRTRRSWRRSASATVRRGRPSSRRARRHRRSRYTTTRPSASSTRNETSSVPSRSRVNGRTCARASIATAQPQPELRRAGLLEPAAALLRGVELVRAGRDDLVERRDAVALSAEQAAEALEVLAAAAARGVAEHDAELGGGHVPALVEHLDAGDGADLGVRDRGEQRASLGRGRVRGDQRDGEAAGEPLGGLGGAAEQDRALGGEEAQQPFGLAQLALGERD